MTNNKGPEAPKQNTPAPKDIEPPFEGPSFPLNDLHPKISDGVEHVGPVNPHLNLS